jgi:hypothetical protein
MLLLFFGLVHDKYHSRPSLSLSRERERELKVRLKKPEAAAAATPCRERK